MQWLAAPTGKRGRSPTFSDTAIQFCLTIKCLFGQPLRQTLGLVQSLLRMAGLPWTAPDYSTVCRRQKSLEVQVHYKASTKGLQMLADSTCIESLGEDESTTKNHGAARRRQWRKAQLIFIHFIKSPIFARIIYSTTPIEGGKMLSEDEFQLSLKHNRASYVAEGARLLLMRPEQGSLAHARLKMIDQLITEIDRHIGNQSNHTYGPEAIAHQGVVAQISGTAAVGSSDER